MSSLHSGSQAALGCMRKAELCRLELHLSPSAELRPGSPKALLTTDQAAVDVCLEGGVAS